MVSEELFELCQPILQNTDLDDEEQTEQLEDLLRSKTTLTGASLENAVLDILWRQRNQSKPDTSPPSRHTVIRRSSPAPWQVARSTTPISSPSMTGTSPAGPGFHLTRAGISRGPRSVTASPFTSPRPSPRLAFAQPIPHSPNLNAYEFSDQNSPSSELYGDFGSESNVDWLVADDQLSVTSSIGGLSASAPEFVPDMSPHDILRSVLGDKKTNDEIEAALEANSYDLGATIAALSGDSGRDGSHKTEEARVVVGKSMTVDHSRPSTPSNQGRNPVVCKYWLSTGTCLRADCRFSHDLTNHICKYWMMGNCLAGDGCPFSHDPTSLIGNLSLTEGPATQSNFQLDNNQEAFPALQTPAAIGDQQWSAQHMRKYANHVLLTNPAGNTSPLVGGRRNGPSRPQSRPTSRHQQRDLNPSPLSVDDPEAFPALSAMSAKAPGKKHHGKRGGHNNKDPITSSLADVVRVSSPGPGKGKNSKTGKEVKNRELSAAALAIPAPQNIPWLETGPRANQQYIRYRTDAIRHGTVRNKFLQSAAQAWNRSDARAAKALSLRGQAENEAMRRCHREAARQLYEEREQHLANNGLDDATEELYVDLHGLHPEEAVKYLDKILVKHSTEDRILYAITGTGHHSKNGKDKVGKAVKVWLNELKYVFREFSVPGERGGYVGGVLGIDPTNYDKEAAEKWRSEIENQTETNDGQPMLSMGKVQLLKREDTNGK
ncbi:CCCH zinc finger and SMR domain protein [Talaromyces stipitatus ATCC 10500]|uniref:CCCH zinc finger and SMR domain protein n=1 Tax=Talaromyces stipitatus (strain ATCC 10500 / CBS 375.48 / QM 6759 / NRRL 1006) TaxID=441959 RepID=B8MAV6_TALSN|nr:CCCH zinc finger and SMR domain protein [Talaromyces stipitatus ATCC 10500]EED17796.1 CCCH zinc finger and SMR domain protein [Talaromyces stipitatus ATCC 10500]